MKDKSKKLHQLQDILIDEFIGRIQSGEASPSDLNAARQLLKDNGIHAALKPDNPLANLVAGLPFDDESDRVVMRPKEQWESQNS
tara:strand:+ start:234 stop:488 length:255 start_codon:yes stop_codon:yes gene_type:complete